MKMAESSPVGCKISNWMKTAESSPNMFKSLQENEQCFKKACNADT